ncbi:MAG: sigma-54-dependent Fis family transcriptional regulator, partial [Planctomycetaceae bacterium]|nr:sigma-54-dependent Fis family transcriptional regulator [Planctomycetaceae bacterium]
ADGGTLFLDEVGDMSPMTQSKLLRVLQERTLQRVGGEEVIRVDVRVIAATNHNLEALVSRGQFRTDLFFRLRDYMIHLPPLRERGDDIRLLTEYFIRRHNTALGRNVTQISPAALEILSRAPWPGNVRELESVIKQSLLSAAGSVLTPECLPASLGGAVLQRDTDPTFQLRPFVSQLLQEPQPRDIYTKVLSQTERELFRMVLRHTGGNQLQAAGILGISRVTLRSKLRSYGIIAADFGSSID